MSAPLATTLKGLVSGLALALAVTLPAQAADKITFLTNWYAQAEHGGAYQAKATGIYEKAGLDVTIKQGGPQVNGMQLLLAGETDFMIGYDIQVLKAVENNIPVITIATSFQNDLQGIMAREDVKTLADLKDKTLLVATSGRTTWWPWLKKKYGMKEEQTKPYTFNLQPFFADMNTAQQAYPSSEPFQAEQQGTKVNFLQLAKEGYPPYGSTFVTTKAFAEKNPELVKRFLKATLEGWSDYLKNPAPGNVLIKESNPKMTDEQIAFGVAKMREMKVLDGGDAATMGMGIITDARFKATYDFLVDAGLLKAEVDYKAAFTDRFVKDLMIK